MFTPIVVVAGMAAIVVPTAFAQAGEALHFVQGSVQSAELIGQQKSLARVESRHYIVQFKKQIQREDRRNLTSLGARVLRYLPDDALVVRADRKTADTIAVSSPNVRLVVPYQAQWKVSPDFGSMSVFSADRSEALLVRVFEEKGLREVEGELRKLAHVRVEGTGGRTLFVVARQSQVAQLAALDGVEWVQPRPQMETFAVRFDEPAEDESEIMAGDYTDLSGNESGTKLMKFESAWARGFKGAGQKVAMADTGLDTGDNATLSSEFKDRVPSGYAFGMFAESWEDPMGHGTHVAGSVLGSGAAAGGLLKGGAFEAEMVAEGMWSPVLGNLTVPPKLAELFIKAYDDGARIHTNSWGSPRNLGAYDAFAQQTDEYAWEHPDFLVIFAAGNSGVDADKDGRIDAGSVSSPGTAKNVLTVGASENDVSKGGIQRMLKELNGGLENWGAEPIASDRLSNNANGLAAFSSRGPTRDGRIKPEVVAPGTNILSARSHHKEASLLWGEYNSDYVWSGGTSMSTPLVAGGAAVVREYLIKERKIEAPSAALVKGVLMHTAFDIYPGQFGEVGASRGQELLKTRPTMDAGYGRVDMEKATDLARTLLVDEKTGLGPGDVHRYPVHVDQAAKMTVTLVYTDAPASPGAAKTLVNDLDVVIRDPQGQEFALNDRVNNNEMIEKNLPAGDYEILVRGENVPQGRDGRQAYALIVSVQ